MRNLETSIINSALWAAAGDAIGWISELTDTRGLERRSGAPVLTAPVKWKRRIGGISGVTVDFDAGSYSDDTQLRLAVCRAIRGDGTFDIEPYAKIELPVWLTYSLGAGRASKAAAINLAKRDVNWFSNFFPLGAGRTYVHAGGNGAAMRIQPHVWRWAGHEGRKYLDDVVRDSLVTHGNMRAVCGAVFHADCLDYVLKTGEIPGPAQWRQFVHDFSGIEEAVNRDFQLSRFWLSAWEQMAGIHLRDALYDVTVESVAYIDAIDELQWGGDDTYAALLETLHALSAERRGTGTNTALAAAGLAWDQRSKPAEQVILCSANAIGSDTDTIGTMVGALVGANAPDSPTWPLQDHDYIVYQARRMAMISRDETCDTFAYPDLIGWQPPQSLSDAIGTFKGGIALAGLGPVEANGKQWQQGEFAWQWFRTSFGQTILCKTRTQIRSEISEHLMPEERALKVERLRPDSPREARFVGSADSLPLFDTEHPSEIDSRRAITTNLHHQPQRERTRSLEALTEIAISSGFSAEVLGECLLECSAGPDGIERSISFAAIIAKAISARRKRASK
ncbi:ADP-ribosylglycohydrolase family protein [Massilia sp. NR 4-1]|uniref:ADP-ribosylglycohydrolase family protein n=1 Tax=Massilia sp. NR 4-1 TaxID=1678028 RepID=UPI000ADAC3BC|nr:ADP-ribosylglycohydrolase family protein [Massilia sp. NR 4-1]